MYTPPPFNPTIPTPSPHSPLSPPVKTACVISWIVDNASRANAPLFAQPLWTKFTRKASVLCSHYRSETYYTSLKTDLFPKKSIWASCGEATPCTATQPLNHKHQSFIIALKLHNSCTDKRAAQWYVVMSNQLAVLLTLTHFCLSRWKTNRLQVDGRCRPEGERCHAGLSDLDWKPEGIWSSDVMCLDLQTAPDWSGIPSHRPRSLPKPRGRRHRGQTQYSVWGRLVLRPHTNNYSCLFFCFFTADSLSPDQRLAISAHLDVEDRMSPFTLICYEISWHHLRNLCNEYKALNHFCKINPRNVYVMMSCQSAQSSLRMRFPGWADCQPHHSSTLLPGRPRKVIHKQCKRSQSLPSNAALVHSEILFSWSCDTVGWKASGSKRGQLQSCHLGSTCFRNHRWRSSLHSTHGNSIHSTRRHAALEISFVPMITSRVKKSSAGKLDSQRFWKLSMTSLSHAPVVN